MRSTRNQTARTIVSAAGFAVVLSVLFQSWEIAAVITVSLAFHELGHILVIQQLGIRWQFGFSPLGAWTWTPLKARQAIGHFANSLIHLAGPFFSFLLSVGALVLFFTGPFSRNFFWVRLANFSVLLGLTNLLPIGSLSDGGKFLARMSASLKHRSRTRFILLTLQLFVILYEHIKNFNRAGGLSIGVFGLWFAMGIILNLRNRPADETDSFSPMSENQAGSLFSFIIILILYSYLVTVLTPFWLNEEDAMHMLSSFEQSFFTFIQMPAWARWAALASILAAVGLLLFRRYSKSNQTSSSNEQLSTGRKIN